MPRHHTARLESLLPSALQLWSEIQCALTCVTAWWAIDMPRKVSHLVRWRSPFDHHQANARHQHYDNDSKQRGAHEFVTAVARVSISVGIFKIAGLQHEHFTFARHCIKPEKR
jgi:hypothetical protein